jgi:thiamine-phosphate pyrophosphorylase
VDTTLSGVRGLYAIVDVATLRARDLDPLEFARSMMDGGASTLQLRDKRASGLETLALLEGLVALAQPRGVPVYANDRVDLALLAGASGVHVGQGDIEPARARSLAERAGIRIALGRSTHDERELLAALAEPIDYVAIGPVRSTSSKPDHEPVLGEAEAMRLARLARASKPSLPRVAIGGIAPSLAAELFADFDAVAVIGGLVPGGGRLARRCIEARPCLREGLRGPRHVSLVAIAGVLALAAGAAGYLASARSAAPSRRLSRPSHRSPGRRVAPSESSSVCPSDSATW